MPSTPLVVILAAGQGTRMRSATPKVLHRLGGRPLIDWLIDCAAAVSSQPPVVILNPAQQDVIAHVEGRATVALQPQPLGSGDAVRHVADHSTGCVVVLSADVPLVRPQTVARLIDAQSNNRAALLTTLGDARHAGLGRVYRNADGSVDTIVEERDLVPGAVVSEEQNVGVYAFDGDALWPALDRITTDNAQGEYYLTDVVRHINGPVAAVRCDDPGEALGINDRRQLALAEAELRRRTLDRLMESGVTIEDPATTYIDVSVEIGRDSVIRPLTVIRGATRLGAGCEIGPMAQLADVVAGDRVQIGQSVIEDSRLGDDVVIGHFDRVRPNTELAAGVSLGTHAEVKNSRVGARTRIGHFSCVLDADLGADVNIGAGTVTCNYDGEAKHRTEIGDSVFVGTNSTLVAPLAIAAHSYVAAGSLVDHDVPAGALAVGRAKQRNVEGWVARKRGAGNGASKEGGA